MKKCCFVKFLRKHTPDGFLYEVVKDIQPNDDHSELVSSLTIYNKIDLIKFDDIDSNTNLIITIDVVDVTDLFLTKLKLFIDSVNCKSIFFDFSTKRLFIWLFLLLLLLLLFILYYDTYLRFNRIFFN